MKLLVLQLSDIHISQASDPVLARAPEILAALQPVIAESDNRVLAITGDIAFSGEETQYQLAIEFLTAIATGLQYSANADAPAPIISVPGNHDCDFSSKNKARDIVARAVPGAPEQSADASIVGLCTQVQEQYFAFRHLHTTALTTPITHHTDTRLLSEYSLNVGSETVHLITCNTAWLSQLHEQQGHLFYPSDVVPAPSAEHTLVLTLFHHPYNWLDADNARAFREAVERGADLVLTGHEHEPGRVTTERPSTNNTYIEGGVLQNSADPQTSSFNAIVIDTAARKYKTYTFEWDGTRYIRQDAADWDDFRLNRHRARGRFAFSEATRQFIEDPGVNVSHEAIKRLRLDDFYIYPDLREFRAGAEGKARVIPGDQVVEFVASSPDVMLIGDSESGKTALAKMLMARFLERGDVPVLLDGRDGLEHDASLLFKRLEDTYARQYEPGDRESYRQLSKSRRVVIIDDYHRIRLSRDNKRKMHDELSKVAGRTIMLAHDFMLAAEDLTRPDSTNVYPFVIQPLSQRRRHALIENWLLLGKPQDHDAAAFAKQVMSITRTFDTIVGNNFVPSYPAYLLSVLQAADASMPLDTRASAHGYYYELFIRTSLARGRTAVQYDILMGYLAFVAHKMFEADEPTLGMQRMRAIHDEYEHKYDITLPFETTITRLVEQRILQHRDDELSFRYRYVYYYFVASFLRDHITEPDIRRSIQELTASLWNEEHANIVLFLAHVSKDPLIIDEMLKAAQATYPQASKARLDGDVLVSELDGLKSQLETFIDQDARASREDALDALDRADAAKPVQSSSDPADPIVRLGMALKTLQILGQIVKNFPGSLDGETKLAIVRECCDLGLRLLGAVYTGVAQHQSDIAQDFIEIVKRLHPTFSPDRVVERAFTSITNLLALSSLGALKRVAMAIGSPHLEATYERVFDASVPSEQLISIAIRLEHAGQFPMATLRKMATTFRDFPLAMWVLRALTIEHFRLFPIELGTKQAACAQLGIKYEQMNPVVAPLKLLGR